MRRMIAICAALALGGAASIAAEPAAKGPPGWLAGCWIMKAEQKWVEECWTPVRAGMMLGSGRSGAGESLQSWEANQILPDAGGKPVFWASPQGAARVAFPMVSQGASEIVFANPAHDYPQRIRYWRDGKALNAEISLADGSKPMRWSYTPM
ncbi:DUF6265 family protein [Sphingomonas sp.]|uniref:DUF6265 family protein n=1 Tax=Sphingomonas sp. TaxID=28214 RepID=UPI003D6CDEE5